MTSTRVSFTAASIRNGPGVYDRQMVGPPCGSVLSNVTVTPETAVTWQISSNAYGSSASYNGSYVKYTVSPTCNSNSPVTGSRSDAYRSMVPLGAEIDFGRL